MKICDLCWEQEGKVIESDIYCCSCGRDICEDCLRIKDGQKYCKDCIESDDIDIE